MYFADASSPKQNGETARLTLFMSLLQPFETQAA